MNENTENTAGQMTVEQAMETPRTLTIASKEWASRPDDERFQSLEDLKTAVNSRRSLSRETIVNVRDISAEVWEDGLRVMMEGNDPATPTNWSFGQLARAADFRVTELRKLSAETAVTVLNEQLQKQDAQDIKVMRLLGDDQDKIQAVTGPSYGRIFDAEVVEMVEKVVEMSDGKFYNPKAYDMGKFGAEAVPSGLYASDRDVFIFMIDGGSIFDAGPRAQFNRGFIVSNSEVGKASLTIMSFLFNQVCGNHFIFGATGVNMRRIVHSLNAPARFADSAFSELQEFARTPVDLTPFTRGQEIKLEDIRLDGLDYHKDREKWGKAFGQKYGFVPGEVRAAIVCAFQEEHACDNVFQLAQGFTASARTIPHIDSRVNLERRAGEWLEKITR